MANHIEGQSESDAVTDTSNARLALRDGRTNVTVMAEASGGQLNVTVEVSDNDSDWYEVTGAFPDALADGAAEAIHFQTGAPYVRASGDANVGRVALAGKGA